MSEAKREDETVSDTDLCPDLNGAQMNNSSAYAMIALAFGCYILAACSARDTCDPKYATSHTASSSCSRLVALGNDEHEVPWHNAKQVIRPSKQQRTLAKSLANSVPSDWTPAFLRHDMRSGLDYYAFSSSGTESTLMVFVVNAATSSIENVFIYRMGRIAEL